MPESTIGGFVDGVGFCQETVLGFCGLFLRALFQLVYSENCLGFSGLGV